MGWIRKLVAGGLEELYFQWQKAWSEYEDRKELRAKERRKKFYLGLGGHFATDEFIRSVVKTSLFGKEKGQVVIAIKSWTSQIQEAFVPKQFQEGVEQRYLVNPGEALTHNPTQGSSKEPEAFRKQRVWEERLVPGKLYKTTQNVSLMPRLRTRRSLNSTPFVEKDSILLLVSVEEGEKHCPKTGNFTKKYEPGPGDTYAVSVLGRSNEHIYANAFIRSGMFGSRKFGKIYKPLAKQTWIWIGNERVINWSFTYNELEEIESKDD